MQVFFFTLSFGASIGTKKGLDEVNKACHLYLLMLITLSDYVERCLEYNSQTLFHFLIIFQTKFPFLHKSRVKWFPVAFQNVASEIARLLLNFKFLA